MNEMFKKAIEDGVSDLHIKAGDFARARLDGALIPLTEPAVLELMGLAVVDAASPRF